MNNYAPFWKGIFWKQHPLPFLDERMEEEAEIIISSSKPKKDTYEDSANSYLCNPVIPANPPKVRPRVDFQIIACLLFLSCSIWEARRRRRKEEEKEEVVKERRESWTYHHCVCKIKT